MAAAKYKQPPRAELPAEKAEHLRELERQWRAEHPKEYYALKKRYRERHAEELRDYGRKQAAKVRENMPDHYIKCELARRFGVTSADLPQEDLPLLIDLMRGVKLLKRLLKEIKMEADRAKTTEKEGVEIQMP